MLFELKRGVEDQHIYQALCQLMLANTLSSSKRPVVVLTDLVDHWQLFWLALCTQPSCPVAALLQPSRCAFSKQQHGSQGQRFLSPQCPRSCRS